nr:hypothetical protein [uncultured Campylobacter sp.]
MKFHSGQNCANFKIPQRMKFYATKFRELKFLAKVKFDAANSIARILRFEILNLRIPLPRRAEFAPYPLKLQPRYPLTHPF